MSGNPPRISFRAPSEDELWSFLSECIRVSYAYDRLVGWVGHGTHFESDARASVQLHAGRLAVWLESPEFVSVSGWNELVFYYISGLRAYSRSFVPDHLAGMELEKVRSQQVVVTNLSGRLAQFAGMWPAYEAERHAIFQTSPKPLRAIGATAAVDDKAESPPILEVPTAAEPLTPGARAIAAAYDLQKEGRPVSVRAACLRAKVDRTNLRKKYPEAVEAIEAMSGPVRDVRRGGLDARSGSLDGWDSAESG